jgi:translation initiation factor 2B subunit (eIF-2B alpha/beta/delta family)
MDYPTAIKEVMSDNTSGAQRITEKVVTLIVGTFAEKKFTSREIRQTLTHVARDIISAQPAMASLFNLFSVIFERIERVRGKDSVARAACQAAQDFAREMVTHTARISLHFGKLLRDDDVVLTHSASQAVREGLVRCWHNGRRFSVICTESRPVLEGMSLACELAQMRIPTCLLTEAQAFAVLKGETEFRGKLSIVIVGADSVSAREVTNKAGTLGLAVAAKEWSVPFYVLAGSEKFLPVSYPIRKAIRQKPVEEILSSPPEGLTIMNRYFDITPLSYITAVVTEKGLLPRQRVAALLRKRAAHPLLKKLVQKGFETLSES